MAAPTSYLLRDIPPDLHAVVLAKARAQGTPLRSVILRLLAEWSGGERARMKLGTYAPVARRRSPRGMTIKASR